MERIFSLPPRVIAKRLVVYVFGIYLMTLGVSFSVASGLGVSPVNAVPYVVSEALGISMGICTVGVYCIYLLVQLLLLGQGFHPTRLLQLLCTFLFGWFVDLNNTWTAAALPAAGNYLVQLLYLAVGIALVGLGIFFYLGPHLLSLPGEGCMQVISEKFSLPLHWVKIGFDLSLSAIALVISLACFHGLHGVREGTVLAAFGVGKVLGLCATLGCEKLNRFMEREEPPARPRPRRRGPAVLSAAKEK